MEHTDRFDAGELTRPVDPRRDRTSSGRALGVLLALLLVGALAVAWYVWQQRNAVPPAAPQAPVAQAPLPGVAPQPNLGPAVRHPIESVAPPAAEAARPLPVLADSDADLREALAGLLSAGIVEQLLQPDRLVRRFVATIDNLPRQGMSADVRPVKPPGGALVTVGPEAARQIGLDNARRYEPYVHAFASLDSRQAVALYVRFYPLFQQAYRELGYPNGYFNDRLVDVIDNVLAAPVVEGAVGLVQPKVLYEYADPGLQSLSAGQKVMVRMGPENAAKVKAKLREIRRLVAAQKP
jgi:hypothetical protein